MRPDQLQRLRDLEEALAEVFLEEAHPDGWAEDRTERYKQKREAAETAQLLARAQALMAAKPDGDRHDPDDQKQAERLVKDAERRATEAMERVIGRAATKR